MAEEAEDSVKAPEQTDRPTAGAVEERTAGGVAVDGRKIRGLIPYGIQSRPMGDGWREVIEHGALRNADISELRAVIDHKGVPLGRYPKTLDVEDSDDGLRWSVDPPKSRQDVVEAVERGDMRAGSWRMVVGRDEWRGDVRHVHEIKELLDVTIVGAEEPAYEAAVVEYRSTPRVTNEPEQEKDMSEDREVKKGGLEVEDRKVEQRSEFDFISEVADFARDVKRGETRSLSTTITLSNPEYGTSFFDLLRPRSVFLASGVPILSTDSDSLVYPQLSSDPTVAWFAEGGTISASDPGFGAGTAIPRKIATRVEYSNEVAEDSSPELEGVLRTVLAGRAAVQLDIAMYEGTGAGNQPTGIGNLSGIGTVNAAGLSTGSVLWAGTAIANLEGNSAPRPYAYVGGTSLIRRLREVRTGSGGTVDEFLFPVGSEDLPSLWGARGFIAPHLAGGTAYIYSPSSMYLVNRVSAFDIEVDRSRLFDRDMSEMRLRARVDVAVPYPTSVQRGTGVPA
jgi:HK97 family phage major capsid protein